MYHSLSQQNYRIKRNPTSNNFQIIITKTALIKAGKRAEAGLKTIELAKQNGKWDEAYSSMKPPEIPKDLTDALLQNELAWKNFNDFSNPAKIQYVNGYKRQKGCDKTKKDFIGSEESHSKYQTSMKIGNFMLIGSELQFLIQFLCHLRFFILLNYSF